MCIYIFINMYIYICIHRETIIDVEIYMYIYRYRYRCKYRDTEIYVCRYSGISNWDTSVLCSPICEHQSLSKINRIWSKPKITFCRGWPLSKHWKSALNSATMREHKAGHPCVRDYVSANSVCANYYIEFTDLKSLCVGK